MVKYLVFVLVFIEVLDENIDDFWDPFNEFLLIEFILIKHKDF
jgi:hypothetical protein